MKGRHTALGAAAAWHGGTGNDALSVLAKDHREVEQLFDRYRSLGARATKAKEDVVRRIVRELSVHAAIEEMIFYPRIRETGGNADKLLGHALEEHQTTKQILARLDGMSAGDAGYDELVRRLMEDVGHHVAEEEAELFPRLQRALSEDELTRIGEALRGAKKTAPTRPHPMAPNTPPGNIVAGMAAAVVDRARDAGRSVNDRIKKR